MNSLTNITLNKAGKPPLSLVSESSYSNHQQLKAGETSTKLLKPSSDYLTTSTHLKSKRLRGDIEQLGISKKRKLIERIGSLKMEHQELVTSSRGMSLSQMMKVNPNQSEQRPLTLTSSPGQTEGQQHLPLYCRISERHISSLRTLPQTQKLLSMTSYPHLDACLSLQASGSTSCAGNTLTSSKSLIQPILPSWTQRKPMSLMMRLNLPYRSQNHPLELVPPQTITSPSPCISKQLPSSFPKGVTSSCSTTPISVGSFTPWKPDSIQESLSSTDLSKTKWPCKETYASLIIPSLSISEQPSSPPLALFPLSSMVHLLSGGSDMRVDPIGSLGSTDRISL